VFPEFRLEPRLNSWAGTIDQCEKCFDREASEAEKHANLRKWVLLPVRGDPRGVADDREAMVPVTARAVRRQSTRFRLQRQKVVPQRAILRQVLTGDSHAGGYILPV
jgi:hypothetical protein